MTAPAFSLVITENAVSISCGVRASTGKTFTFAFCAAAWTFFSIVAWAELAGFTRTATRDSLGTMLSSISRSLGLMSTETFESPVMLPPGRARLLTKPLPTGSLAPPKTIGIVVVAFCAALVAAALPSR